MSPRSGDVLRVTRTASAQFAEPILFRVIRAHDWPTYRGWIWLDGYQLNAAGDAVDRRSIFVRLDGLGKVSNATTVPSRGRTVARPPVSTRPQPVTTRPSPRPIGATTGRTTAGAAAVGSGRSGI
ncbi:hypothetical protein GCM10027290_32840 [Micromonospora sonneratiae]|uniref:Uncharacterized protein n=1 Tax=Micromonospora sonneratiae TaxID=1184706 RepID=A0ABW3YAV1_9ACTN